MLQSTIPLTASYNEVNVILEIVKQIEAVELAYNLVQ